MLLSDDFALLTALYISQQKTSKAKNTWVLLSVFSSTYISEIVFVDGDFNGELW